MQVPRCYLGTTLPKEYSKDAPFSFSKAMIGYTYAVRDKKSNPKGWYRGVVEHLTTSHMRRRADKETGEWPFIPDHETDEKTRTDCAVVNFGDLDGDGGGDVVDYVHSGEVRGLKVGGARKRARSASSGRGEGGSAYTKGRSEVHDPTMLAFVLRLFTLGLHVCLHDE